MPGSGSQATLQGPESLPTVNLREEALAGTGVRQAAQCFCECPRCAGDTAQWKKKLTRSADCLDWTAHCVLGGMSVRKSGFLYTAHSCLLFQSFHCHFEKS